MRRWTAWPKTAICTYICQSSLWLSLWVDVCLRPSADRWSCIPPINRAASISASRLHAKNSQSCVWRDRSHILQWPHTRQDLAAAPTFKQHFCLHAGSCPVLNSILATATARSLPISHFTPQAYMYLSSRPIPRHPRPQRDNRLLGCQAAEPLWDGRDDNMRSPAGIGQGPRER